jgi:DNA-binding HxlR family transcriptional regulator
MAQSGTASKRSYHQYCGLASALDVLGERWTLLIVRELLMGPRRYGQLLADLPGIGTNLLADRLKSLVERGVIRQTDAHHTGSRLSYELTPVGLQLRPMVLGLAHWGLEFVGDLTPEDVVRPHWGFLAVEAMFQLDRVSAIDESYEFRVDGETFRIEVSGGVPRVAKGGAEAPAMVATTDAATFVRIGAGRLTPLMAMVGGTLRLEGDMDAVLRSCALLGLEPGPIPSESLAKR